MSRWESGSPQFVLPKPGKTLKIVMGGLFAVWLMFAIAINWGDASQELFLLFCGNTDLVLQGQVWRLFTAPLMHLPQGSISHIAFALIGLYFLTPSLEQAWGGPRLARFLIGSALIAYGFQMVMELLLPANTAAKLVGQYWFGAVPVLEAIAIAWAASFRGQQVRLMFVLPVSSTGLIWFVVAMSVLRVIALSQTTEGLLSPFGGMAAGWLLGSGTPSPLRRWYLRVKLGQVERGMARDKQRRSDRVKHSKLGVIEGGKGKRNSDEPPRGPDGNMLN
jgi:membrane associated rhomboid family serine protease